MRLDYIKTMDFTFEEITVLNCKTIEELKEKIKENEVIDIDNHGIVEHINSCYIMYFA